MPEILNLKKRKWPDVYHVPYNYHNFLHACLKEEVGIVILFIPQDHH